MLRKSVKTAFAGFGLCALLVSCGESTPDSGAAAKPKPIYEIPQKQLAAEKNDETRQQSASSGSNASQTANPSGAVAGGVGKIGFGSSSGPTFLKKSEGGPSPSQAQSSVKKPDTPVTSSQTQKKSSGGTSSSSSSSSTPSNNTLPPSTGLAGVADQSAINAVSSYATGEMALSVKKNVENKLNTIQSKHNDDLKKALDGN